MMVWDYNSLILGAEMVLHFAQALRKGWWVQRDEFLVQYASLTGKEESLAVFGGWVERSLLLLLVARTERRRGSWKERMVCLSSWFFVFHPRPPISFQPSTFPSLRAHARPCTLPHSALTDFRLSVLLLVDCVPTMTFEASQYQHNFIF